MAQPVSFGVKAGGPLTDFFHTSESGSYPYTSTTNRYVIGPTIELQLPVGFSVEFDALYRHYHYLTPGFRTSPPVIQLSDGEEMVSGGAWEFPLLAKYRFPSKVVRPYVDAGIAWDTVSGLSALVCALNCGYPPTPPSLRNSTVTGAVAGVGTEIRFGFLRFSPEIRYTHWGARHFVSPVGGLSSIPNQVELLLGISFSRSKSK